MRLGARIKKIENQVYDGKGITLTDFLKGFPKGKAYNDLRQLLIERLPHTGPLSLTEILDAFPEDLGRAVNPTT
jgi:hypothetical protein